MEGPVRSNYSGELRCPPASVVFALLVVLSVFGGGAYVFFSFLK